MLDEVNIRPSETEVSQFVAGVGGRVKSARRHQSISRKVLSDLSGVSQRYLAQLESGTGNISLAILYRIAVALEKDPKWFLEFGGENGITDEILNQFQRAKPELRKQIEWLLSNVDTELEKAQRICLIGLRGAGKSTLGKFVAEHLSYEFIELNDAIERHTGMAISEVMALYGQEGYRKLEGQAIKAIIESRNKVILAAAGGVVSDDDTFNMLLTSFHTVWLRAQPEEHMQRVRDQGDIRPMAGNERAMDDLKSILTAREAYYARADLMVDTSGKELEESQRNLLSILKRLELN